MSKRDARRAITGLFAERDEAIAQYAENYLRRQELLRDAEECAARSKGLRDKAIGLGARPRDLKAAEEMIMRSLGTSELVMDSSDGREEDDTVPVVPDVPSDDGDRHAEPWNGQQSEGGM